MNDSVPLISKEKTTVDEEVKRDAQCNVKQKFITEQFRAKREANDKNFSQESKKKFFFNFNDVEERVRFQFFCLKGESRRSF